MWSAATISRTLLRYWDISGPTWLPMMRLMAYPFWMNLNMDGISLIIIPSVWHCFILLNPVSIIHIRIIRIMDIMLSVMPLWDIKRMLLKQALPGRRRISISPCWLLPLLSMRVNWGVLIHLPVQTVLRLLWKLLKKRKMDADILFVSMRSMAVLTTKLI